MQFMVKYYSLLVGIHVEFIKLIFAFDRLVQAFLTDSFLSTFGNFEKLIFILWFLIFC